MHKRERERQEKRLGQQREFQNVEKSFLRHTKVVGIQEQIYFCPSSLICPVLYGPMFHKGTFFKCCILNYQNHIEHKQMSLSMLNRNKIGHILTILMKFESNYQS